MRARGVDELGVPVLSLAWQDVPLVEARRLVVFALAEMPLADLHVYRLAEQAQ